MTSQDRQPNSPQFYIDALGQSIRAVRETFITPQAAVNVFESTRPVAEHVMGLETVPRLVYTMRFGLGILGGSQSKETATIQHADGSETSFELKTPSEFPRSTHKFLNGHFHFHSGALQRYKGGIADELMTRFRTAGITSDYIDRIASIASGMAVDIAPFGLDFRYKGNKGIDETKLTVECFQEGAKRMPQKPDFVMDPQGYHEFLAETGIWLQAQFERVLDNVLTGRYLVEQEHRPGL